MYLIRKERYDGTIYAVKKGLKTGIFYYYCDFKKSCPEGKYSEHKECSTIEEAYDYLDMDKESDFSAVAEVRSFGNEDRYGAGIFFVYRGEEYHYCSFGNDKDFLMLKRKTFGGLQCWGGQYKGSIVAIKIATELGVKDLTIATYKDDKDTTDPSKLKKTHHPAYHKYLTAYEKIAKDIDIKFIFWQPDLDDYMNVAAHRLAVRAFEEAESYYSSDRYMGELMKSLKEDEESEAIDILNKHIKKIRDQIITDSIKKNYKVIPREKIERQMRKILFGV